MQNIKTHNCHRAALLAEGIGGLSAMIKRLIHALQLTGGVGLPFLRYFFKSVGLCAKQ